MASFDVNKAIKLYEADKNLDRVSEEMGCCRPTLTKYLRQAGVDIKVGGKGCLPSSPLSPLEQDLLIAGLLGDGHLKPLVEGYNTSRFSLTCKHKEYTDWYKDRFTSLTSRVYVRKNGVAAFQTNKTKELGSLRMKWYTDAGKVVPRDWEMNPTIALHWYLQDGHLSTTKSKRVTLSTQSFTIDDCEWLVSQLQDFKASIKIDSKNMPTIIIGGIKLPDFLEYIGWGSPVSCFDYKFLYENEYINRGTLAAVYADKIPALGYAKTMGWEPSICWQRFLKDQNRQGFQYQLSDLATKEATTKEEVSIAKKLILENEWLRTTGSAKHFFVSYINGTPICVLAFGYLNGDPVEGITDGKCSCEKKNVISLLRGATIPDAPHNSASKAISQALDIISSKYKYNIVSAFSDPEAGELGTIYQACSFDYIGTTRENRTVLYNPETGKKKRSWSREADRKGYATRNQYTEHLLSQGWTKVKEPGKHKYVKVIGGWREDGTNSKWHKRYLQSLVDRYSKDYPKVRGK